MTIQSINVSLSISGIGTIRHPYIKKNKPLTSSLDFIQKHTQNVP